MRKVSTKIKGIIRKNDTYEGECIEQMLQKRMAGEEIEIGTGKELVYTERKDGVLPITNIRTDRFDVAQSAMDLRERNRMTRRDAKDKAERDAKDKAEKENKSAKIPNKSSQSTDGASMNPTTDN